MGFWNIFLFWRQWWALCIFCFSNCLLKHQVSAPQSGEGRFRHTAAFTKRADTPTAKRTGAERESRQFLSISRAFHQRTSSSAVYRVTSFVTCWEWIALCFFWLSKSRRDLILPIKRRAVRGGLEPKPLDEDASGGASEMTLALIEEHSFVGEQTQVSKTLRNGTSATRLATLWNALFVVLMWTLPCAVLFTLGLADKSLKSNFF